ncbi:MAG TPA: AMP-binding protein [Acidimicrobiia bacterium]|jgi:acyl-CoA synthetase (AMP-forming)/AMP-acid ligase II
MWPGLHAAKHPDKPAQIMASGGGVVTYRELDERSNQLARLLRDRGLDFRDHIAIFMDNNDRYVEVAWAAQRSGLYFTPINFHFNADEVAYIVDDCDARAIITSVALADVASELVDKLPAGVETRLVVGGKLDGYEPYEEAIAGYPAEPLEEELEGHAMMYSSGTTGRPKGIRYQLERKPVGSPDPALAGFGTTYGIGEDCVYLSPAPLYHAAPLQFCIAQGRFGGTNVILEHFDAEGCLAAIERYRVTHAQFVPTMFVRMLKLPEEVRAKYDLSSLEMAIHAAAPCPVEIKRRMIEWWGPIIFEYYSSTEGMGSTMITSEEWLAHPGSVGQAFYTKIHILDEDGNELPPGEPGVVWFEPGDRTMKFEYHKDPGKTAGTRDEHGWSSVGDIGYLDEDGYLYLTDRRDFMIVSGGVNIYPQEAENVLITHDKVMDAAVFGVPDPEMGQKVHAVVQPIDMTDAGPDLERELVAFCRDNLAHYKCPKAIDFDPELPRQPTGKLYKRLLRDRYWGDSTSRIV